MFCTYLGLQLLPGLLHPAGDLNAVHGLVKVGLAHSEEPDKLRVLCRNIAVEAAIYTVSRDIVPLRCVVVGNVLVTSGDIKEKGDIMERGDIVEGVTSRKGVTSWEAGKAMEWVVIMERVDFIERSTPQRGFSPRRVMTSCLRTAS